MASQMAKWRSQFNEKTQTAFKRIEEAKVRGRVFIEDVNDVAQDVRAEIRLMIAQRKSAQPASGKTSNDDERWFAKVNGSLVPDSFDRGEIELPW